MSTVALQTFADPFYSMTTTLSGSDFIFEFKYSQREACWYFDISLNDGTLLVAGVKVVCGVDLLARFADVRLPPGTLFAFPNSTDDSPPGLEDLGPEARITLLYHVA